VEPTDTVEVRGPISSRSRGIQQRCHVLRVYPLDKVLLFVIKVLVFVQCR
jgi:hypothetical protein